MINNVQQFIQAITTATTTHG